MFRYRSSLSLSFCFGLIFIGSTTVHGRQNILIGEVSIRYDHQDRTYTNDDLVATTPADEGGAVIAADVGETGSGVTVVVLEDRRGDRQQYFLTPRLTFSSTGISDVFEVTYAPSLNYDHLDETTDLDHDFGLRAERNLTRNWLVSLNNRFFLGDDPVRGEQYRTAAIVPETGEPVVEEPAVGSPAEGAEEPLTERFGRRRYWTNTLDLSTDYDYGADRTVTAGYSFDVLRNDDSDAVGGYTDYDRHTGSFSLNHRFNQRWSGLGEVRYSRGLFDEPDVVVVNPPENGGDARIDQVAGTGSDDLAEYTFRARGGYDTSPHLHLFTEYSYLNTDYDAALREDYAVHNIGLGIDYDVTQRLHVTLSGGPSWGSFENSPTETDYNAYAGLTWDYMHGALTFFAEKGYDQSNFDGRRSGLTDFWRTGVALDYQLTRALTATVSATYRDNRRLQYPTPQTIVVVDDGQPAADPLPPEDFGRTEYTEKDYDAGFSLAYTFLRWYTISGGYRYYNHDSDLVEGGTGSYYEHRAFVQLAVSKELLRW